MKHTITINGRELTFAGNPDDAYFKNLPTFHGENDKLEKAIALLPRGAISFDVGANIGLTALAIATANPTGHVYAFEPSPRNTIFLRENIRANGIENVTVIEAAVGQDPGVVMLHLPPSGAHSTVIRDVSTLPKDVAQVKLVSLDNWAKDNGVGHVDFIKIDVEGYESQVIRGAAGLLADHRPSVLMEFNSITIMFEARESPWAFAETLISAFDLFSMDKSGDLSPIRHTDLRGFVYTNMAERGFVDDIVLRLKAGVDKGLLKHIMTGDPLASFV